MISDWRAPLRELCAGIRTIARKTMVAALEARDESVARPAGQGAGDVTFGLDIPCEELIDTWFECTAARTPLSLLTEDRGWRHAGPRGTGAVELAGFDHGGPRIAIDPIDGTRNLMHDLRSAWTVVSFAGPGAGTPRMRDLAYGLVTEIPTSLASRARHFEAVRGSGASAATIDLAGADAALPPEPLTFEADDDGRPDHGYFPFFAHTPDQRRELAPLEAAFFEHLAGRTSAALETCYHDHYIASAGQLMLLASGTYRMIVDVRSRIGALRGHWTAKPYDLAGAVLVALEAGCPVLAPSGEPLDFPLDAHTPVDFVGFLGPRTRKVLWPSLEAAFDAHLKP